MRRVLLTIPLLFLLLAGCADRGAVPRDWQGSIDTLPNGAVHVLNPRTGLWSPEEAWRLREDLRIGSVHGDGPDSFGRIADLVIDVAGRMYVLDAHAKQVRVFDAAGRHIRDIGRAGSGPGEFRNPSSLALLADGRLVVVDPGSATYVVFDSAGRYIGGMRRDLPRNWFPWRGGIDEDGNIFDWVMGRPAGSTEPRHMLIRIGLHTADSAQAAAASRDTFFLQLPHIEQLEMAVPGGVARTSIPFGPELAWWIDADERSVWTTTRVDYRFTRTRFSGDTVLIVQAAAEPVPVTDEERADVVAGFARSEWQVQDGDIPATKPAVRSFAVDADGQLWAVPTLNEGHALDVFDTSGLRLGRIDSPVPLFTNAAGPPLRITRDAVYAITRDELDVEYIVRLRIERPSP